MQRPVSGTNPIFFFSSYAKKDVPWAHRVWAMMAGGYENRLNMFEGKVSRKTNGPVFLTLTLKRGREDKMNGRSDCSAEND